MTKRLRARRMADLQVDRVRHCAQCAVVLKPEHLLYAAIMGDLPYKCPGCINASPVGWEPEDFQITRPGPRAAR